MNTKAYIGLIIIHIGLLAVLAIDTILFGFTPAPSNYDGDSRIILASSLFWVQWISHCMHYDLNLAGRIIWCTSGLIGGLLSSKLLVKHGERAKKPIFLYYVLLIILLGTTYIKYEWRFPNRILNGSNIVDTLQAGIFSYFPYLITFAGVILTKVPEVKKSKFHFLLPILLFLSIFISAMHFLFMNLLLCA
ncbi:MAG: hypothetical protein INQ03_03200 [Candidatus Heimdallarchaeota archaeon]|nr:hypothetical protein [Candidatus Heimdallarchaeota archaeon]